MKSSQSHSTARVPTLVIGNVKGGVGKSLLATCLSVAFAELGRKVFLIDADIGQNTTQEWIERRERGRVAGGKCTLADIGKTIAAAANKSADMVIVDLGGRDDAALKSVLELAHLVLIPAQPSMPDLQATNRFIRIAKAAGAAWSVVLTRVKREDSARAREYVDQYAAAGKIAPVHIGDRVSYQDAYLHGRGVTEFLPASAAASEIRRLRDHLDVCLKDARHEQH